MSPPLPDPDNAVILGEVHALRRELALTWEAHTREHTQHELAHAREHQFAQDAIDKAAEMAKVNKADANEWRATMNDREVKFATKEDVKAILGRLESIERANIAKDERERINAAAEAEAKLLKEKADTEEKRQTERRQSRQQWQVGIAVTILVVLINLVIRLLTTGGA